MSAFIFSLTLRQLLGRKSTWIPAGLALIPVLVSLVYAVSDAEMEPLRWTTRVLLVGLVVTAVLPLTALLLGTAVLGDELEEGTAVYLLTRPIERWQILLPKIAAATLVTAAFPIAAAIVGSIIALGELDVVLLFGYVVGIFLGALAYTSVFVLLSLVTSRALVTGLVYVFIWEATITTLFSGARYLSIRHYALGVANWLADTSPNVYEARVDGPVALALIAATAAIAIVWANRRLQETEVREAA